MGVPLFPGGWSCSCAPSPFRGSSSLLAPVSLPCLTLALVGSPGRFLCVGFGGFAVCSPLPFPSLKFASPGASDPSEARGVIPCPSGLLGHAGSILRPLTDGPVPTRVTLLWRLCSHLQGLFDAHQRAAQVIKQPIKTIKREEWKRRCCGESVPRRICRVCAHPICVPQGLGGFVLLSTGPAALHS